MTRPKVPKIRQEARRGIESGPAAAETSGKKIVPVIEEELVLGRRRVKTGSVRIDKHVEHENKTVDMPLTREFVDVRRFPRNQIVNSVPQVREVGRTLIIPVVQEELVVTKRLVLKEEIHVVRHATTERSHRTVRLARETAEILRLDSQGRIRPKKQ